VNCHLKLHVDITLHYARQTFECIYTINLLSAVTLGGAYDGGDTLLCSRDV